MQNYLYYAYQYYVLISKRLRQMEYNTEPNMTEEEMNGLKECLKLHPDIKGYCRYIGAITSEDGRVFNRQMEFDTEGNFTGVKFW